MNLGSGRRRELNTSLVTAKGIISLCKLAQPATRALSLSATQLTFSLGNEIRPHRRLSHLPRARLIDANLHLQTAQRIRIRRNRVPLVDVIDNAVVVVIDAVGLLIERRIAER